MTAEEIGKIKYGDYLELKYTNQLELAFGRVIHVTDPSLTYFERKVIWTPVYPTWDENKITWDYEYLRNYVSKIITARCAKRFIKLLYDC